MQDLTLDQQLKLALIEVYTKRRVCALLFAIVSLTILSVGLNWPKYYEASTTLIRDKGQIVRPLLEGAAIMNSGIQQAEIAREVIYSNKALQDVIRIAELDRKADGSSLSDRELEVLRTDMRGRIQIRRDGDDVLKISYTSQDPMESFVVVRAVSDLFIKQTTQTKRTESNDAYKFIDSQVNEYKQKLDEINQRINDFRSENVELQVDTSQGVSARINDLNAQIRSTELELKEASIQKLSLLDQLRVESEKSSAEKVVNVHQLRLEELERQLGNLRLSYTETYPDIVQLNLQIESLRRLIAEEEGKTPAEGESNAGPRTRTELAQRLQQQIADQELRIRTLETRREDQVRRRAQEIARSSQVNQIISRLEELSRDREVTKELYDQLLTRREKARVSLSLELENAGALFKVQEPPVVPLVPKGLRFLHFALASLVLGIGVPVGIVVALLLFDPRIRHEDSLDLGDNIPVFGSIPAYRTPKEIRSQVFATVQAGAIFILALSAIVSLSLSRYYEIL